MFGRNYIFGKQLIFQYNYKNIICFNLSFAQTDPENQDYAMENGAIRNFESLRLAEKQAETEAIQKKEEEENNPMKVQKNFSPINNKI